VYYIFRPCIGMLSSEVAYPIKKCVMEHEWWIYCIFDPWR